jgi:hypothetical protein
MLRKKTRRWTMRLDEALAEVQAETSLRPRQAHNPTVVVDRDTRTVSLRPTRGARLAELTPEAIPGLLRQAAIPKALAERISPATFATVATEALGDCTLLLQGEQIVDVAPAGQYHHIDPLRVAATIDRAIPNVDVTRALTLPNHTVRLETVGVEERPVQAGDLVRAGALVQFSPLGLTKPLVQSYAVRLVCTNGVTSSDVLREFSFGGDGDGNLWAWFRHAARDAYGSLAALVQRFQTMQQQEIAPEHRASVLASLLREAGIRGKNAEAIRAQALATPPQNAYDMANLITWATTHVVNEPMAIVRAERVATRFIGQTEHRELCPTCHRWMN